MASNLEDLVTCPVCLEIFNDPHALPCLHTFCLKCAKRLKMEDGKFECPTCRNPTELSELKKEFKTEQLLGVYKASQQSDNAPTLQDDVAKEVCDLCEEKPVMYKCHKCGKVICQTCKKAHIKISECKDTDAEMISTLSNQYLETLKQQKQEMDEKLCMIQKKLQESINSARDQQRKSIAHIRYYREIE